MATTESNQVKTDWEFPCDLCKLKFSRKYSMQRHKQNIHNVVTPKKVGQFVCVFCEKEPRPSFTQRSNLFRHVYAQHPEKKHFLVNKHESKTVCPACSEKFKTVDELRKHIELEHQVKCEQQMLEFPCEENFQEWKKNEETETSSLFIKINSSKMTCVGKKKHTYYFCHRSGHFKTQSTGQRRHRQGITCKIQGKCPATIVALTDPVTGHVKVTYHKTHFGHSVTIDLQSVSKEDRDKLLQAKRAESDKYERILNNIIKEREEKVQEELRKMRLDKIKKKLESCIDRISCNSYSNIEMNLAEEKIDSLVAFLDHKVIFNDLTENEASNSVSHSSQNCGDNTISLAQKLISSVDIVNTPTVVNEEVIETAAAVKVLQIFSIASNVKW